MSRIIEIPTITELPKNPQAAASFIWEHQDRLNAISHPGGIGTLEVGRGDAGTKAAVGRDYRLAVFSEVAELQENFLWKHWSVEAREGRRWQLLNPAEAAGEGTLQNVRLEVIDIVFFVVSYLQAMGVSEQVWLRFWCGDDAGFWSVEPVGDPATPQGAERLVGVALELTSMLFGSTNNPHLVFQLGELCQAAGMDWKMVLDLYAKKLIKNYERQARGRKQVGDTLAHAENASVVG
jgi:hypothetical protein